MKKIILAITCIASLLSSCEKSKDLQIDNNKQGQLKIKFDHIVGSKKLVLNEYTYSNTSNETFNITMLRYFVSNIKLTKLNGDVYSLPKEKSFFLIDAASDSSLSPKLLIPEGEYKILEFNLGVDSLTNTLPIEQRTGVLDIATNGMYWAWNSGYIHFKLEGNSPQSTNANKSFKYHIGLFGGYDSPTVNNNRKISVDLTKAGLSKVQQNLSSDIHLMVDIGKIFDGKHTISIQETPVVMTSGPHTKIADNYATMFSHDHTHNFQKL
ncbi:MbnP family protein [Sphingobacterium bovistauri]|uniref:Copper-binding protein MbnP-like domain-containing protein n=1 Tax=Sphingobacterium bovistauri TaxID=2781959 RepID=A0ABS7Z0H7_9SPHI|nr:MbnP family protein [Sphingobacterium bovistauri]MCA5003660.1 hypothetical protein [Sphingobacterium bovistauri]